MVSTTTNLLCLSLAALIIGQGFGAKLRQKRSFGTNSCGRQADGFEPIIAGRNRIIGGGEAKPNSWPWLGRYYHETEPGSGDMCGANLIRVSDSVEESDIAITAAHCVTDIYKPVIVPYPANTMTIRFGAHKQWEANEWEQTRTVQEFVYHPEFSAPDWPNDIAVLKLEKPVQFTNGVKPVCLPTKDAPIPSNQQCVTAGWGRHLSQDRTSIPEALKQLSLPVQPADVCKKGWDYKYKEEMMICAGELGAEATKGVCEGDSGSELVCRGGDNEPWTLYGVTSFVPNLECLAPDRPAVFARVSNYLSYIEEHAKRMTSLK